ncbi:DUF2029 domain-containing protein [Nocardioides panacis]|uniref:DUF2029 domain-containing protein n=1 Tax=Nocardioides panacis TaxID=2849501 RepID=A0A975XYI0_9ACTN|nr:glycosyltransferase 87 family protein [Nocardioides panacis]QWZ06380.1 DUF2029 domain-containing protein [Nocardioides panacis]
MALVWMLTRVAALALIFGPERDVLGDVGYFSASLRHLGEVGLVRTMPEYPLPAVAVVALPWRLSLVLHAPWSYGFLFVVVLLAVDAAFTALLQRQALPQRRTAVAAWLVALPALGGLSYVRFDLIPGVLVGMVVLVAAGRSRLAALLLALAACIKLWPVLLVPPLLARSSRRTGSLLVLVGAGAATVLVTLVAAGASRVWSPLAYQADRGLQVESVAATPVMLARHLDPASYQVRFSPSKSYEITGPGVPALLGLSTILTVGLLVFLAVLWTRLARTGRAGSIDALVWASLAATAGFLCTSKVLSPQYLLWLLPTAIAGLAVVGPTRRALARWTGALIMVALLSHGLYPWLYAALVHVGREGGSRSTRGAGGSKPPPGCVALVRLPYGASRLGTPLTAPAPSGVGRGNHPDATRPRPPGGGRGLVEDRRGSAQCLRSSSPSMPCRPSNW